MAVVILVILYYYYKSRNVPKLVDPEAINKLIPPEDDGVQRTNRGALRILTVSDLTVKLMNNALPQTILHR